MRVNMSGILSHMFVKNPEKNTIIDDTFFYSLVVSWNRLNHQRDSIMKILKITASIVLLFVSVPSFAAEAEDIIKYRISVMEAYGSHMSAASRIVRGKVDFQDQLKLHADSIDGIAKTIGTLFPEDSDFGDTRAKEEVWSKAKEFDEAVKANQQAAADFNSTVAGGDSAALADSFKKLSDSCKSCHEKFRTEEE
jgi:cytochrome c556